MSYSQAMQELNQILESIADQNIDVDILASKVERATQLIAFCREKLTNASNQIEKVLEVKAE